MKITKEQLKRIIKEELEAVMERSEWQEKSIGPEAQSLKGWQHDLVAALPKYAKAKYPDHSLNLQPPEFRKLVTNFLESPKGQDIMRKYDIPVRPDTEEKYNPLAGKVATIERLWSDIKSVIHDEYGTTFQLRT